MASIDTGKKFFKTSEVCQLTDTQPYVLRFWESEFPQLSPQRQRGGQAVYRRADVDLVLRIKQLLYDEEYTIDGARRQLEQELTQESGAKTDTGGTPTDRTAAMPRPDERDRQATLDDAEPEVVSRRRYDDAVEEIAVLRIKIKEAEANLRKAESRAQRAEKAADRHRQRTHRASSRLEQLLERLDGSA